MDEQSTSGDAFALYQEGVAAFRRGEQEGSRALSTQALELARAEDDALNEVRGLIGLARVAFRAQDHAEIERLVDEAMPVWERLSDDEKLEVTDPSHMLAESCRLHGKLDEARRLYHRNIEVAGALGDVEVVEMERMNLALLEVTAGDYDAAHAIAAELIAHDQDETGRTYTLLALGAAEAGRGERDAARSHLDECVQRLEASGEILDPADQPILDAALAKLEAG